MLLAKSAAPRCWRQRCAAVLVSSLVTISGASAFVLGRTGGGAVTVQVKRAGAGPAARTVGGLRIVDGSTAEVLAATGLGARGRVKIGPPPGVVFAVASIARPKGLREGVSRPFAYDGGARLTLRIALEPTRPLAPGRRAGARRPPAVPGGLVATLGPVTIAGPDGVPVSIAGPLFTPLFNDTSDVLRWVDTSEAVRRARQRELDLQDQGLADPSTHIDDSPLAPDLRIEGELTTDGRDASGELRIVDPATGQVLERLAVDTQGHDWSALLAELARRGGPRRRARAPTSTTSHHGARTD